MRGMSLAQKVCSWQREQHVQRARGRNELSMFEELREGLNVWSRVGWELWQGGQGELSGMTWQGLYSKKQRSLGSWQGGELTRFGWWGDWTGQNTCLVSSTGPQSMWCPHTAWSVTPQQYLEIKLARPLQGNSHIK